MVSLVAIVGLLVLILLGVLIGWLIKSPKAKAITGGLLIGLPFVVAVPIFAMAESTECDGGDCGGAMMLLGFLALFLVPVAVCGGGVLIQALFARLTR